LAPNVRGGRLAHPPRVEKVLHERINKKERIRAILSALSASAIPDLVRARGHMFSAESLPVIVVDDFEKLQKTAEVKEVLKKLGVWEDIERAKDGIRIRAGKGKMRGRRYVEPRSVLIIVSSYDSPVIKAVRNLPGVDVATPDNLGILHLAPGGDPGRLIIITRSALEKLSEKYEVITP